MKPFEVQDFDTVEFGDMHLCFSVDDIVRPVLCVGHVGSGNRPIYAMWIQENQAFLDHPVSPSWAILFKPELDLFSEADGPLRADSRNLLMSVPPSHASNFMESLKHVLSLMGKPR